MNPSASDVTPSRLLIGKRMFANRRSRSARLLRREFNGLRAPPLNARKTNLTDVRIRFVGGPSASYGRPPVRDFGHGTSIESHPPG